MTNHWPGEAVFLFIDAGKERFLPIQIHITHAG